jgi:hypothetical protein
MVRRVIIMAPGQCLVREARSRSAVYTTYFRTTRNGSGRRPGLHPPLLGIAFDSEWKAGSAMTWQQGGVTISDPAQVILELEPYRRLSYTRHSYTPERAEVTGLSDEYLAGTKIESRSVTDPGLRRHRWSPRLHRADNPEPAHHLPACPAPGPAPGGAGPAAG